MNSKTVTHFAAGIGQRLVGGLDNHFFQIAINLLFHLLKPNLIDQE